LSLSNQSDHDEIYSLALGHNVLVHRELEFRPQVFQAGLQCWVISAIGSDSLAFINAAE